MARARYRKLAFSRGSRALHPTAVLMAEQNRANRIGELEAKAIQEPLTAKELREWGRINL